MYAMISRRSYRNQGAYNTCTPQLRLLHSTVVDYLVAIVFASPFSVAGINTMLDPATHLCENCRLNI